MRIKNKQLNSFRQFLTIIELVLRIFLTLVRIISNWF